MSPDSSFLDKIDPQLQEKLAYAPENEVLRVIVRLGGENQFNINSNPISPADFPNRTEYRKALIAHRQQQLVGDIGETKKAIKNLALKTYGGVNTRTLVVEGTVNQILNSLELSGIESATLDRSFAPIAPSHNFSSNNLEKIFLEIAEKANIIKTTRFNRLAKFVGESDYNSEENTKQLISQSSQKYIDNYYSRYGFLKVLGIRNPISLESIHTNVRLLVKSEISQYQSLEEIEKKFRQESRTSKFLIEKFYSSPNYRYDSKDFRIKEDLKIANQEQYLIVLGTPGSGKSTLLKKIALGAINAIKQGYQHECIPVLLELKRFNFSDFDIKNIIIKDFKNNGFTQVDQLATTALQEGKLLILLDGLDEVSTTKYDLVVDTIKEFVSYYNNNRFIISCRTAFFDSTFNDFTYAEIAKFNNIQIKQYINNWFNSKLDKQKRTAKKLWSLIHQPQYEQIKKIAKTPLLLNFLCLVYSRLATLPNNRSILYSQALRVLLEEWGEEKNIYQNQIYQGLDKNLEKNILLKIAYNTFVDDKLFFPKEEVTEEIEKFLKLNLDASKYLDKEAVFNAITIQQGLIVVRTVELYSFSHLELHEYLTAQYIVDHNLIKNLVKDYLLDTRWQEVFLLVAGLMQDGADELLLLMEKEAISFFDTSIGRNKLIPILDWAEKITEGSSESLSSAARRAIANAFVNAYAQPHPLLAKGLSKNVLENYLLAIQYDGWNINLIGVSLELSWMLYEGTVSVNSAFRICGIEIFNRIRGNIKKISKYSDAFQNVNFTQLFDEFKILKKHISQGIFTDDIQVDKDIAITFVERIRKTFENSFSLKPELYNLSEQEIIKIDQNYYYIYNLILLCKASASKLDEKTWSEIENRILRVPEDLSPRD